CQIIYIIIICHHPHISDTRYPIASQQLYLVTLQHILILAMFHLVYNQDQRSIIYLFHNTLFYSLILNSTNNPLLLYLQSSIIINLLFQHPLPLTFTIKTHCHFIQ
ncbi:hypothetical protein BCR42DRAFT_423078, partial [Absidia repens]